MILDRVTDWIVTAWELIGLLFLAISADLLMPRRREPNDVDRELPRDGGRSKRSPAQHLLRQPHFV